MTSLSSAIINTPYGPIKTVTAKEFVKLIPKKEWYSYTDSVGYYRRGVKPADSYFNHYETIFTYLTKSSITVAELVKDLSIEDRVKYDLMEMIYDITTESAIEMGNPTHIVRLGRRFWMAANPEDFIVFFNLNGTALANLRPNKSIVWLVNKP